MPRDPAVVARRGRAALKPSLLALCLMLATGAAGAAGVGDTPNPGSPLPGGGTTRDLTSPGNGGVAGTGLGGSTGGTGNGAASGTGSSVKGPAGQGLDGQGRSDGIGTGATTP